MAHWTNHELRRLVEMHANGKWPEVAELAEAFPRHTLLSIKATCRKQGVRIGRPAFAGWLRRCHLHFQERERLHGY